MIKQLGRNPVSFNSGHLRSAMILDSHLARLPAPPNNSSDYVKAVDMITKGDWGMDANDEIGDCTAADFSHQTMLWTANTGKIIIPTKQDTIDFYSASTGYNPKDPSTDRGGVITQICDYAENVGFMGSKLSAYAPVDHRKLAHVLWSIQIFGTVKLGITLPESAESQFDLHMPWTVVPKSKIAGGHDVCAVRYRLLAGHIVLDVVTWGRLQTMALGFFNTYVDEVIAPYSPLWIGQSGTSPSGFDGTGLLQELNLVR